MTDTGAPDAPRAYVRLTLAAADDLRQLVRKDPQVARWAVKKMLLLERDPMAGAPLFGDLIGWRKLTVGDRDWRVVWRVTRDDSGQVTVTIAEVWAVGARSAAEVYAEMSSRVAAAPGDNPLTATLAEVVGMLGRALERDDIQPAPEPVFDPVPGWLRERLVETAGIPDVDIAKLTGAEAMRRWEQFLASGQ